MCPISARGEPRQCGFSEAQTKKCLKGEHVINSTPCSCKDGQGEGTDHRLWQKVDH